MIPNRVDIGDRYGDDSGWERLVCVDKHADRFDIEIGGGSMSASLSEIKWLIEALSQACDAINGDKP